MMTSTKKTKQISWTGQKIRLLRESMKLTRKEFARHLNLSAAALEKWELSPEKEILPKYSQALDALKKNKTASAASALLAPTALLPTGLALWGFDLVTNRGLKEAIKQLSSLEKLSEEERKTLVQLWNKMQPEKN